MHDNDDAMKYARVNVADRSRHIGEREIYYINPLLLTRKPFFARPQGYFGEPPEGAYAARFYHSARFHALAGADSAITCALDRVYTLLDERMNDLAARATCRNMQLADPPVREVVVEMISGDKNVRNLCGRNPTVFTAGRFMIERETGVLFGDVVDVVKKEYRKGYMIDGWNLVQNSQFGHLEFPGGFPITAEERKQIEWRQLKEKKVQQFKVEVAAIASTRA
ncbi:hypothetical protein CLAFUW4_09566 [Fulvia fulva]|uniref:Uncharacterized protein n=1 Tax=Passalora fulva TaxID=5499 RepID=A0A9Q8PGB4_PASFU|nr:uncharacterized protein CLAFUR5_09661 [Fulvia fulva]KAK4613763.1 hypothetical protein CLAFUR4_09572 [Fulvia fulva]KAK4615232.1 hypothetical protein CLAFUR0_09563 [Fulvia fulva]UJO21963.1 hypothetical protein CLAFUR5_09661 [Fulvia fulva]WPV20683.1 hypothetical protein CLAFUW4_09566 [Fulvia fulva]WPV34761.1 hypothetical protein CLAFUW7_09567 [Fulvia fulva]